MIAHVIKAEYKGDYRVWLRFNDGAEGVVDLKDELYGEMFEPLKDIKKFKSFRIDPELETLVWENGADFAPEFLRDHLLV
ncbi:MAG: DUF2442 domain-containing protein [Candidatus Manganitrophus sp. SA1]|nr:DUF2442 domain-containing protein [Candidatus Manganitrophus morganii]